MNCGGEEAKCWMQKGREGGKSTQQQNVSKIQHWRKYFGLFSCLLLVGVQCFVHLRLFPVPSPPPCPRHCLPDSCPNLQFSCLSERSFPLLQVYQLTFLAFSAPTPLGLLSFPITKCSHCLVQLADLASCALNLVSFDRDLKRKTRDRLPLLKVCSGLFLVAGKYNICGIKMIRGSSNWMLRMCRFLSAT